MHFILPMWYLFLSASKGQYTLNERWAPARGPSLEADTFCTLLFRGGHWEKQTGVRPTWGVCRDELKFMLSPSFSNQIHFLEDRDGTFTSFKLIFEFSLNVFLSSYYLEWGSVHVTAVVTEGMSSLYPAHEEWCLTRL